MLKIDLSYEAITANLPGKAVMSTVLLTTGNSTFEEL